MCAADEYPLPAPTNLIMVITSSYSLEGGTRSFANSVGSGNVSMSALMTDPAALSIPTNQSMNLTGPISATGQIYMAGTLAKQ
jgi:hypothetical protein